MQQADSLALHTQLQCCHGAGRSHACDAAAGVHVGRHVWHCIKEVAAAIAATSS